MLQNKKFSIIFTAVVLILLAVAFWFFSRDQHHISSEAVKAKCLEESKNLSDDELIEKLANLKESDKSLDFKVNNIVFRNTTFELDRMSLAVGKLRRYLICKSLANPNDEDFYNRAKNFIENINYQEDTADESKKTYLEKLEEREGFNKLILVLATVEDLTKRCEDGLNSLDTTPSGFPKKCDNICDVAKSFSGLEEGEALKAIEGIGPLVENKKIREVQTGIRIAYAYRSLGEDFSRLVCKNMGTSEIVCNDEILRIKEYEEYIKGDYCETEHLSVFLGLLCEIE